MENQDFLAMMKSGEVLDHELTPYLREDGLPALRHPLVYQVPYTPVLAAWSNAMYRQKKERITQLENEGNYSSILTLYERPYRVSALLKYAKRMAPSDYWKSVGWVWADTENAAECWEEWAAVMADPRPERESMMSPQERAALEKMPEVMEVWRGQTRGDPVTDFSWTLNKKTAKWFALRFNNRLGEILRGEVRKEAVLAYLTGRGEAEIMAWPTSVNILGSERIKLSAPKSDE